MEEPVYQFQVWRKSPNGTQTLVYSSQSDIGAYRFIDKEQAKLDKEGSKDKMVFYMGKDDDYRQYFSI
jgi:hypothetical protein